jgi:uncharacterized membrane protein
MTWTALPLAPGGVSGAAYSVSADGNTSVGYTDLGGTTRAACYWSGLVGLVVIGSNFSEAYGASADGNVIVGNGNTQPFIWTPSGGLVPFAAANDLVWGISSNGTTVIGQTPTGGHLQACFWNRAGVRTNLGFLPGHNDSRTRGVSADGTYIVGESRALPTPGLTRAFRWSTAGGMIDLGLTSGATSARAFGVSNDGAIVAGDLDVSGNRPFQWTLGGGMIELPHPGSTVASATAVSGDGNTISGYSEYPGSGNQDFAYWTSAGITVPVPPSISTAGTYPTGVSADGRTAAGYTFGPNTLPWLFVVPPPSGDMMVILLPNAEVQFIDANGHPYSGGTLEMYARGTSTPKDTWLNPDGGNTNLNTNPIVLDSAGRAIIYGDGAYRTVLRAADGTLVWDQPSFTYISVAMAPVVGAPTIAEARRLLGIDDSIQAETDRAEAAEGVLRTQITAETARAEGIEAGLRTDLNAEIARATAAENALNTRMNGIQTCQGGVATVSGTGHSRITFPAAFAAGSQPDVVAVQKGTTFDLVTATISADASGFDIWLAAPGNASSPIYPTGGRSFYWLALGTPA